MFITPPEKTYSYSTIWKIFAWFPLVVAGLVAVAVVVPDWQKLQQPEWVISLMASAALSIFCWLFFSRELISVHSEGIMRSSLFGAREIRWDQVRETRYSQTTNSQQVGAHFGLIGIAISAIVSRDPNASKATQVLKVISQDGTKISMNNYMRNHRELMMTVLSRVNPRLLNELRTRVKQGIPVDFGKLQLSLEGVRWGGKGPLPYQQIEMAGIRGQKFCMKATGKWMNFVSVGASRVPNAFVALDLIEEFKSGVTKSQPQQLSFAAAI